MEDELTWKRLKSVFRESFGRRSEMEMVKDCLPSVVWKTKCGRGKERTSSVGRPEDKWSRNCLKVGVRRSFERRIKWKLV